MRKLLEFTLPFLFERNWHTGELEYSRERVTLFCGAVGFIVLGILIIAFLQAPVEYAAEL